ncbi:hypothetical protein Ocin01_05916 [Orchesella cincta]|uniref:Uncharacterized protein n=1 Tax=Orchesella cincta TaxID=48709 RepID=A0A1D2N697_ORCCI|nr:hypothetical protein Ocin01_05916 [Orchesella cincta]
MEPKFIQVFGVVTCLIATITAFPASVGDFNKNIPENMEVVDGPKEFLMPFAPLKSLLESNSELKISEEDKKSDLDYMVYGKLYLLKMMDISDRHGGDSSSKENSVGINEAVKTSLTRLIRPLSFDSVPESNQPYHDAIAFPQPIRQTRRPYRYERRSKQELPSYGSQLVRKLEVRSAPTTTEPQDGTSTAIPATSVSQSTSESNLDAEDLELIQTQYLQQASTNGLSKHQINSDDATSGSKVLNESNGNFSFGDRFLINVPSKPNLNACPDGQVRNHRGICKPIVSHNPSPQDGFFEGRITTGISNRQKIPIMLNPSNGNLHLTTLLRYITNREKFEIDRIRIISETEKQSKSQLVMGQGNAEGSASHTAENNN